MAVGKEIKTKGKHGRTARIRNLTNYIMNMRGPLARKGEKVLHSGAQGFVTDNFEDQQAEMIATATQAKRSRDPVIHLVISVKEGETISSEQARRIVDIQLKEFGLEGHQCMWAVHDDTDNIHIHISVNRVNAIDLQVKRANNGFTHEAIHRAIARIETLFGYEPEKRGLYQVQEDGCVKRKEKDLNAPMQPDQRAVAMENKTGEKSAQRVGIEEAGPILKSAKSWKEVHEKLEELGMRYERAGKGAVVWVGDVAVKSSSVERSASIASMQKRLGPFEKLGIKNEYYEHQASESDFNNRWPGSENCLRRLSECHVATATGAANTNVVLSSDARPGGLLTRPMRRKTGTTANDAARANSRRNRESERGEHGSDANGYSKSERLLVGGTSGSLRPGAAMAGESKQVRRAEALKPGTEGWTAFAAARKEHFAAKNADTAILNASVSAQREQLKAEHKAQREELFKGKSWTGRSCELAALRSVIASLQVEAHWNLQDKIKADRLALRTKYKPFPDFESWLTVNEGPAAGDKWRFRDASGDQNDAPGCAGGRYIKPKIGDIHGYAPEISGAHVRYLHAAGSVAFIDTGRRINVVIDDDASILVMLQLGSQKWGSVELFGSDEFKRKALKVACENSVKITNKGLQPELARLRAQRAADAAAAKVAAAKAAADALAKLTAAMEAAKAVSDKAARAVAEKAAQAKPVPVAKAAEPEPAKPDVLTVAQASAALKVAEEHLIEARRYALPKGEGYEADTKAQALIDAAKAKAHALYKDYKDKLANVKDLQSQLEKTPKIQLFQHVDIIKKIKAATLLLDAARAAGIANKAIANRPFDIAAVQKTADLYRRLHSIVTHAEDGVAAAMTELSAALARNALPPRMAETEVSAEHRHGTPKPP